MLDHDTEHRAETAETASSRLGETVLEDISRGDISRTMHRDLQDIYRFYLDDSSRRELEEMGQFRRGLYLVGWLLRSSILRLSPERRLLLLGSVLFFALGVLDGTNLLLIATGFAALLLVLLLELKDKLLAQDELATGRAVQLALMPREQPTLPNWDLWLYTRPANEVGGDLVDYLSTDGDRLGLALGDVAGKGLGAALLMAKLQSVLRAFAPTYGDLAALSGTLNTTIRRDGLPGRFISLTYLEVAPASGLVRLVNAGHLPALVMRGETVRELDKGGPALGLMAEATYEEDRVQLQPGDWLIVYSDGLTEARDEEGMFFGRDRLVSLLPLLEERTAEGLGSRLLTAVDRFVGEARPSDDLSLLVLRYMPRDAVLPAPDPSPDVPATLGDE
jgi:serine phosphatase RsbU (regulator of sigma subunit)